MNKFILNIPADVATVEMLIKQMPGNIRRSMLKRLEKEDWGDRLDETVSNIRKKFKEAKVTEAEINTMCREARKKSHAQRG